MEFATGLINYCHLVPETTHLLLCMRKSLDPSFTVLDLMEVIGKSSLVDFYRSRLHFRARSGLEEGNHDCAAVCAELFEGFSGDHRTAEERNADQV